MVKDDLDNATGFAIMDNQSAILAEWDMPVLKTLLLELENNEYLTELTAFGEREIEEPLADMRTPKLGLIDDDEVPHTPGLVSKQETFGNSVLLHVNQYLSAATPPAGVERTLLERVSVSAFVLETIP